MLVFTLSASDKDSDMFERKIVVILSGAEVCL